MWRCKERRFLGFLSKQHRHVLMKLISCRRHIEPTLALPLYILIATVLSINSGKARSLDDQMEKKVFQSVENLK